MKNLLSDKKTKNMIMFGLIGFIVLIIIIVIISSLVGGRTNSYSDLEAKLLSAAKDYYAEHKGELPSELGKTVSVDDATLSSGKYMKEMEKITPKNATCTGKVNVTNTNGNYYYSAYLDCGSSYKTKRLVDQIMENTMTVSQGDGLYKVNNSYVYRGEKPVNYITFAGRQYRILNINEDNTIDIISDTRDKKSLRTVWDDRYNVDRNSTDGINDFNLSRIKENLLEYLNGTQFSDSDRLKLVSHPICIGKASDNQSIEYNGECTLTVENQLIGMLPVSRFSYVSLDPTCKMITDKSCQNYNYLSLFDTSWWTLTGNFERSHLVYMIDSSKYGSVARASANIYVREVLRLSSEVIYTSGNGSEANPYVIK